MANYKLLDSGYFRKLELVNNYKITRPCPQAIWQPSLNKSEWEHDVADVYKRSSSGGGNWQRNTLPKEWVTQVGDYKFLTKPTKFGHLGFFVEQESNWRWLKEVCQQEKGLKVMNLFAYTGGCSMAMQSGGADVTHVDSARGIVDWAKQTAKMNNINNIRWIVDDVNKFVDREIRRGNSYDGFVLDPPSYGRGSNAEIWKIEDDLLPLLKKVKQLLSPEAKFVLLSCHSPNFTPKALENLAFSLWGQGIHIDSGEMTIEEQGTQRVIPSGSYIRITF